MEELVKTLKHTLFLLELFIKEQTGAAVNTVMEEDIPNIKRIIKKYE